MFETPPLPPAFAAAERRGAEAYVRNMTHRSATVEREAQALAAYIREIREGLGEWPNRLLVHPKADLAVVRRAIEIAKASHADDDHVTRLPA